MRVLLLLYITISSLTLAAQQTDEDYNGGSAPTKKKDARTFRERLVFGGGLGVGFGSQTSIQIAPQIGYRTTDRWINGVGINYMYFNANGFSQSIYGAGVWSRFFVLDGIFLATEFESLNREVYTPQQGVYRRNVPIWLVGAGYFSGGDGLGVGIQLLYDLIGDPWSPYQSPIVRGGLMLGF